MKRLEIKAQDLQPGDVYIGHPGRRRSDGSRVPGSSPFEGYIVESVDLSAVSLHEVDGKMIQRSGDTVRVSMEGHKVTHAFGVGETIVIERSGSGAE